MKKIINDPEMVVTELIDGLLASRPDLMRVKDLNCIVKKHPVREKVALVSLGGSGHEPAHSGYIGINGLDGVACGQVFASPSVEQIVETAKMVEKNAGVLFIVKNYTGDNLNTDAAIEILREDGIESRKLVVADDVAPIEGLPKEDRRGVAGTIFVHKILGAASRSYNGLDYLYDLGTTVIKNLKTVGLALSPCIIPSVGEPNFTIPSDKVTLGIGIHGEPGVRDRDFTNCDQLTDELIDFILEDFDADGTTLSEGHSVATMVNGMGGTSLMELYIINRRLGQRLKNIGVRVLRNIVGDYMTSMEMAGFSITILKTELDFLPFVNFIE